MSTIAAPLAVGILLLAFGTPARGQSCNIEFVDKNDNVIDHAQIAHWTNAYDATNKIVASFAAGEEERFFLRMTGTGIGAGPFTGSLVSKIGKNQTVDQANNFQLSDQGGGVFKSGACILVTDQDTVDDKFNQTPDVDGTDDGADDPTAYAIVDGKITVNSSPGGASCAKTIDVCDADPKETKTVKINVVSMLNNAGTAPYFSDAEINAEIARMKRSWGQCCLTYALVCATQKRKQPAGVNLDDGLSDYTTVGGKIQETAEEKLLLNAVKDKSVKTLDIVFVKSLVSTARGEAFWDSGTVGPGAVPAHARTVIVAKSRGPFTSPHEGGHVLLDDGSHFTGTANEKARNLMRSGMSAIDAVASSKRLTPATQCVAGRTKTDLPQ